MHTSLPRAEEIITSAANRWPDRPAVISTHDRCSYVELLKCAQEVSSSITQLGQTPRSVVGISVLGAADFLTAFFGVLFADCIAIPVPPNLSLSEQSRIIRETGVTLIISVKSHQAQLPPLCSLHSICSTSRNQEFQLYSTHPNKEVLSAELFYNAAAIRYTSGTTGLSKGVVLSHQAIIERTDATIKIMELRENDRVLAPLPLAYHFVASALSFIRVGAVILDCVNLSGSEMLSLAQDMQATIIYGSPLQYELIARSADQPNISHLRKAISTSTILPPHTAKLVFKKLGVRLTQVYGIIEVGLPLWNSNNDSLPTALGRCEQPYECKVILDTGETAPTGVDGELLLKGPGLFSGYLTGNGAGILHKPYEWFATGDIVTVLDDGMIVYRGRKKNVINCGGNKVFPEEVEGVLKQFPEVASVRVTSEPHPLLGDLVIAEIVVSPSAQANIETWRKVCYRELSLYKVPKEFRIVTSLPQTGSGKVMYHNNTHSN